jgi:hypothetical protein
VPPRRCRGGTAPRSGPGTGRSVASDLVSVGFRGAAGCALPDFQGERGLDVLGREPVVVHGAPTYQLHRGLRDRGLVRCDRGQGRQAVGAFLVVVEADDRDVRGDALLTGLDTPDAYNAARAEITLARALLHSAAHGAEEEIRALLDAALATTATPRLHRATGPCPRHLRRPRRTSRPTRPGRRTPCRRPGAEGTVLNRLAGRRTHPSPTGEYLAPPGARQSDERRRTPDEPRRLLTMAGVLVRANTSHGVNIGLIAWATQHGWPQRLRRQRRISRRSPCPTAPCPPTRSSPSVADVRHGTG